jgi:crotonobetainyl-CoA:carnitine CoA-transferase CaiB-like acyl-CoA transferase
MTARAAARPLEGIRVLDFSHAAAGPFATMFFGDMGAEVIKIEKPNGGDGARSMGEPMPGLGPKDSDYFVALNRNKKSIVIDLGSPEGAALARRMAAQCDIVVENFRPDVMPRLGLGFDDLSKLRPGLVYASLSAFGPTGPWSERPANDIIMQSVSGLMGITGEIGGAPIRIGAPIADFSSGLFLMSGVLAALFAREAHPEGQHIRVDMLEASLNMMCNYIPSVVGMGRKIEKQGRGHAQIVPYQAFICKDGEYLMVGAFTRGFWHNLCRCLGREEWITDPRYLNNALRLAHRAELTAELQSIIATRGREEWIALLTEADVPNSPVYELHDAVYSEQVKHLEAINTIPIGQTSIAVPRAPIRVDQWPALRHDPPPSLGEHGAVVLRSLLGVTDAEIAGLVERKIMAQP